MDEEFKYTLLTNLSFFQSDQAPELQIHCSAILIEHDPDPKSNIFGPTYRMRGFGVEPSWAVFTWFLTEEYFPFKISGGVSDQSKIMMHDGDKPPTPIFAGSLLTFANERKFFLQAEDMEHPLDVFKHNDIMQIWRILSHKTAQYWNAPYIPQLSTIPAAMLKQRM